MTQAGNVVALRSGPRVADVQARRNDTAVELTQVQSDLAALREARGTLVLDGKSTDCIDSEIAALTARAGRLSDAMTALDGQERKAMAWEAEQALLGYNEQLLGYFEHARKLVTRWNRLCKDAGEVVDELLPVLEQIRQLAAPGAKLEDFSALRRVPAAMVIQFALRLVPPDKRVERAVFAEVLPMAPSYEMAKAFDERSAPAILLAETLKVLQVETTPPPEAA